MRKISPLWRQLYGALFFFSLCSLPPVLAKAETAAGLGWETCQEGKHSHFHDEAVVPQADGKGGKQLKYAPDRLVDLRHLKLEVTPDFEDRSIAGISTLTFAPIAKPLHQLDLDAVGLDVEKVESSVPIEDWEIEEERIVVTFEMELPPGEVATLSVTYRAEPEKGLYFRTEAMGYPKGDDHLWTQGQPEWHRYWFPSHDYPNERFTSEIICHVPEGMTVLSNGRLVEEEKEAGGLVRFHWLQDKEHVNYLISLIAGHLEKLEDRHGDLPLAFYTPPSEFSVAENSFRDTRKIIAFFEKEIGVPYPWDKYYNVCVQDFVAGGMENTSITTLTTYTLFSKESENIRTTHRLDAHEAAHQWFGDLLTCKDWSHLWLNEGFATYYSALYDEARDGTGELRYVMYQNAERIFKAKDDKPIVWRGYLVPREQFDYRAYPKGAWVLHMLRSQLGPDLYRDCIRTYVERNRNQNVVTEDLRDVFEELSGRTMDRFFDQWVFHGGHPKLKIDYAWDQKSSQARISVTQTQELSDRVLLFEFPLPITIYTEAGAVRDFSIEVTQASEDFYFELASEPEAVRIDPDYTVLAEVDFKPPLPMIRAQLELKTDMMGRLFAARMLGGRGDTKSLEALKHTLNNDDYYGVRIESAKALAKTHSDECLEILLVSLKQDDARVRQAVVESIGRFYEDRSRQALEEVLRSEKNPEIIGSAVEALGKYSRPEVSDELTSMLESESYKNRVAASAVEAMEIQDHPAYVEGLKEALSSGQEEFTTRDFGGGLETLGKLARHEEEPRRAEVREFLADYLDSPKELVRTAAIRALGELEDPAALPLLETYTQTENEALPEYKAAEEAVKKLNGEKEQSDEVQDLRKELLELKKAFEELSKKVEAKEKQEAAAEEKGN